MNSNNLHSNDDWYAPMRRQPASQTHVSVQSVKKKGMTPVRIVGLVVLVALLIAGSGVGFAKLAEKTEVETEELMPGMVPELMPDDPIEFFENYYTETQTDVANVNIPRVELPVDFELELNQPKGDMMELSDLYKKCAPSIVVITAQTKDGFMYKTGSGVVISADGLILTNTHIIENCDYVTVSLSDDSIYEAKLVGADLLTDIAVLKIDAKGLVPASFGESSNLEVGEKVAAIGNPLGEAFRFTLTDGIISAIERSMSSDGGYNMSLIQTNAALNKGSSGGALFNMYGQVIGITYMKMISSYTVVEGMGFAIPSGTVSEVVNSIVKHGGVTGRTSVGITVGSIPENAAATYEMPEGLYIVEVSKGSDAYAKGVKSGDVLVEINGTPVKTTDDVSVLKEGLNVGDSMHFKFWREGEYYEVDIILVDTYTIYG